MPVSRNSVVSVLQQLGSSNRQPVNKQSQVRRPLTFPNAITKVPGKGQYISPILGKGIGG
jgi:hypothetical protein